MFTSKECFEIVIKAVKLATKYKIITYTFYIKKVGAARSRSRSCDVIGCAATK